MSNEKTRAERLQHLEPSMEENPIDNNHSRWYTNRETTKVGRGLNNMVLGPGEIVTHNEGANDPGFTFTPDQSELRSGNSLEVQTELHNIKWGVQGWSLNPIAYYLPPNIVNYYDLFLIQPMLELRALGPELKEISNILRRLA